VSNNGISCDASRVRELENEVRNLLGSIETLRQLLDIKNRKLADAMAALEADALDDDGAHAHELLARGGAK
jgi:hypothetical protein